MQCLNSRSKPFVERHVDTQKNEYYYNYIDEILRLSYQSINMFSTVYFHCVLTVQNCF